MLRLARAVLVMVGVMAAASGLAIGQEETTPDDGLRLIYGAYDRSNVAVHTIMIANPYTLASQPLASGGSFACSPRFNSIAFEVEDMPNNTLQVMDINTRSVVELYRTRSGLGELVWSPDGRQIAFTRYDDFLPLTEEQDNEITVVDIDSSSGFQVTDNQVNDSDPIWSPDGQSIIFVSRNDADESVLMLFDRNSTTLTQVTQPYWEVSEPEWSANRDQILAVSYAGEMSNLIWIDLANHSIQKLVENGTSGSWSPDGMRLAVSLNTGRSSWIAIVDTETREVIKLPGTEGGFDPIWTPDGTEIVFTLRYKRTLNLYLMNADGSNLRQITNDSNLNHSPCWLYVQDFPEEN